MHGVRLVFTQHMGTVQSNGPCSVEQCGSQFGVRDHPHPSACVMSVEMCSRPPEHASSKTTAALPHGSEHLLRPVLIAAC